MLIFVSYAFDDKAQFENVTDQFDDAGLPYWKTGDIRAGEDLSQQLRDAIDNSSLCVFIATRSSVTSSWCSAELGAFWGAKKPVLIYLADDSLNQSDLPRQFHGHFLQRRLKTLVRDCKDHLAQISKQSQQPHTLLNDTLLRAATLEELSVMIEEAVFRASSKSLALSLFLDLNQLQSLDRPIARENKKVQRVLQSFLGLSRSSLDEAAPQHWPHTAAVVTSTGTWHGYSKSATVIENYAMDSHSYEPCIFFRCNDRLRVDAVAMFRCYVETDTGTGKVFDQIGSAGMFEFGALAHPYT